MFEIIGLAAGGLTIVSYIPYVIDILRKKVRPERASWLIWSVIAAIAFFSQLAKGASSSLYFCGFDIFGAALTFGLSVKYGVGGLTKRDIRALIAAAVGLSIWYFTQDALYALLITMVVDGIGAWLTVVKTYEDPSSETYTMWIVICFASILAMISVGSFNLVLLIYPIYMFAANFAVVLAKFLAQRKTAN